MTNSKILREYDEALIKIHGALNDGNAINQSNYDSMLLGFATRLLNRRRRADWQTFRSAGAVALRTELGVETKAGRGNGGTLILIRIDVPPRVGEELAKICMKEGIQEGDFEGLLFEHVSALGLLIKKNKIAWNQTGFKQGFKTPIGDFAFRFQQGRSTKFKRRRVQSAVPSEKALEVLICERGLLKDALLESQRVPADIQVIKNGGSTGNGAYKNPDAYAVWAKDYPGRQRLLAAAFEVKRNNHTGSVYKALAQLASYSAFYNEVWLVAPGLAEDEYHNPSEFAQLVRQCEQNGFGIINVKLDGEDVEKLEVVIQPVHRDTLDPVHVMRQMNKIGIIYCGWCGHYVAENGDIEFNSCGRLRGNDCERRLLEDLLNQQQEAAAE